MKLFISALLGALVASIAPQPTFAASAACGAPAYHDYDFFVGSWNVYTAAGRRFASDVVTRELGGCALLEHWNGKQSRGVGYSAYDASRAEWVQDFFQDDGTVNLFTGTKVHDGMLFTGDDVPKPGAVEKNRVLFRPLQPRGFEERWSVSEDGGRTWKVVFDGFFRPA